jgi:PAS domain S-box-containing protein
VAVLGHISTNRNWKTIREDGSEFPGAEHPSIHTLTTGESCKNVVMGVRNKITDQLSWININTNPLFREGDSKPHAVVISFSDITERKRTEDTLQDSEERYRAFFSTSRDCVFITSVDGRWVDLNDAAVKFFGYDSREDLLNMEIKNLYENPEERTLHLQVINEKGYTQEYPVTLLKKDGTIIDTLITSVTRKDSTGRIIGYQGTIRDVTERKRAEEERRASHQIIEGIINAIPVRVFWKDRDLVYLGCNAIFAHDAGFADSKDIVGKDDYQMGWRDQAELYRGDDRQVIESGRPKLLIEEPQTTPEGNTIVLLTSKMPLCNSEGEIIGVLGTYMDITERKQAEKALQESEERFKVQYQGSPAPTFTWQKHGADFVLVDFNEAAKAITNGKVDEFVGRRASDLYADRQEILRDLMQCHDEREVIKREIRSQNFVPGALLVATFASVPPDLVLVHLEDITERKQMEIELCRSRDELELRVKERTEELARKNAEMERFIYTVSHDLRSPLITLSGFVGLLKGDLEKGDSQRAFSDLMTINEAITKMDRLLLGTLELSRIGRVINPKEDMPFREIVHEALEQVAERIMSGNVTVSVAQDMPKVNVDMQRIVEVLVNLIENSVKCMGDREKPKIEIGSRKDGEETVFYVKDNGIGIDPKEHEKIFGLFYKVEKKSEGTGAGLSIVKRIIEVYGGQIWIESELGKGCTVCFTLPLANVG